MYFTGCSWLASLWQWYISIDFRSTVAKPHGPFSCTILFVLLKDGLSLFCSIIFFVICQSSVQLSILMFALLTVFATLKSASSLCLAFKPSSLLLFPSSKNYDHVSYHGPNWQAHMDQIVFRIFT